MKDAKQLGEDFKNNEEIRKGFLVEMNKLRNDENLDAKAAGIMVAKKMGYEVTDEEADNFINFAMRRKEQGRTALSDDELAAVAGGCVPCGGGYDIPSGCW